MKEKYKVTLQIILVFILIICALIFKVIPEYKDSQGSSDKFIDTDNYTDIVELKINNQPNFALVITQNTISNILFFDNESVCLYNKNIENSSIEEGTELIIETLIENDYLRQNDILTITKYKTQSYEFVKSSFIKSLSELNITVILQEEVQSISSKAKNLNITEEDELTQLKMIELYSKDIVRRYNNNGAQQLIQQEVITEDTSRSYADTVYKKIEAYARQNNITNQERANPTIEITKIPANNQGTIFPDATSWYYIQDGQVYAYISIEQGNTNYNYCYQASIDVYKKGQC